VYILAHASEASVQELGDLMVIKIEETTCNLHCSADINVGGVLPELRMLQLGRIALSSGLVSQWAWSLSVIKRR